MSFLASSSCFLSEPGPLKVSFLVFRFTFFLLLCFLVFLKVIYSQYFLRSHTLQGRTLLHWAAWNANDLGHLDVMEELVNRGLFIDCLDVSDMGC